MRQAAASTDVAAIPAAINVMQLVLLVAAARDAHQFVLPLRQHSDSYGIDHHPWQTSSGDEIWVPMTAFHVCCRSFWRVCAA